MMTRPSLSLRAVLLVDAATCVAMGALLTLGSTALGGWTGLPPALLFYAGVSLLPIAAFMGFVATRPTQPRLVRLVVAGNLAWAAGSVLLLVSGWVQPNAIGVAFITAQAVAVAALAWLEHAALSETQIALDAGYASTR
jgi:hypothetical protein